MTKQEIQNEHYLDMASELVLTYEGKTFGERCDASDWLVSAIAKALEGAVLADRINKTKESE